MRCNAKNRDGTRCASHAIKGGKRCRMHGGASPQARKGAKRKLALEQAQRMVGRAGVDMDPLDHLLDSLCHARKLVEVYGAMVAALDEASHALELRGELRYTVAPLDSPDELRVASADHLLGFSNAGEARLHPFVAELGRWVERRAKFAKLCLDAGVAERQLKLLEDQAQLAQREFEATLEELELPADKRQQAREIYARRLRAAA